MTESILNMDEISFRPLSPADADEAARVVRAAFAAQPRLTEPAVLGAQGDGRDGLGEDNGRRRDWGVRGAARLSPPSSGR